ncbi:MAG: hypothetical protein JJW01_03180 [Alphaproteobacteria bacterium]|nr:hypothetical protein [Rickettsiales bacterium]
MKIKKQITVFTIATLCLLFINNSAFAVQMSADRKKSSIEFRWYVSLSNYVTHNTIIAPINTVSVVSLLPKVGFDIIRNFTDKVFLIASFSGGAPYINIDSAGDSSKGGDLASFVLAGGREVFTRENYAISLLGGVDFRYSNLRNTVKDDSLRSNLHTGSFVWGGVKLGIQITKKQSISLLGKFGIGAFAFAINEIGSPVFFPTVSLLGGVRFEHNILISKQNNKVFWFTECDFPFFKIFDSPSHGMTTPWFDHTIVEFGLGFSYGL